MSGLQLHASLETLINNIVTTYEKDILEKFKEKYGNQIGLKIFKLVYETAFQNYHKHNVNFLIRSIKNIINSLVKSIDIRLYNFFTIIYLVLETAISDCEAAFNNFNGELEILIKKDKAKK